MDIISNNNKSNFFLNLLKSPQAQKETKEVKIAVYCGSDYEDNNKSYIEDVINFCKKAQKPKEEKILSFFGGKKFCEHHLEPLIEAKGVIRKVNRIDGLHAKVYWFLNYGVYIGSSNIYQNAWEGKENIECGLWFNAEEPSYYTIKWELENFFKELEDKPIHNLITKLEKNKLKEAG